MSEEAKTEQVGDCIRCTYTTTIQDGERVVTETASMQFPEHSIEGGDAEAISAIFNTLKKAITPGSGLDFMRVQPYCLKCGKGHKKGECESRE